MKEKIKLSGVPETMLQTIYARAKESGGRGTIHDTKAEEIVGKLDYDFTLAEKDTISQIAMSAMDDWGGEIKEQNAPVLVVIEGLTMYLSEADVQRIFAVIAKRFCQATVFVETMNPMVVKRFKEKSIDANNAKFTWGVKNGEALAELLPDFRFVEEHSLCEGMAVFAPVYKVLDKLSIVRNISNKLIVLEKV